MDIWEQQYSFYSGLKSTNSDDDLIRLAADFMEMSKSFNLNTHYIEKILSDLYDECDKHKEPEYFVFFKAFIFSFATNAVDMKKSLKGELKNASRPKSTLIKYLINICEYFIDLKDNIHHCICEELFKEIKNGEEVMVYIDNHDYISSLKNEDAPYMSAFMNAEEEIGNPIDHLHCSLVTKSMISYDRLMFNIIRESHNRDNNDRDNNSDDNSETIFKSYRPYFVEFVIPVDQEGRTLGRYNRNNDFRNINSENGWFRARFVSSRTSRNSLTNSFVDGELLTIASPEDYLKGKLEYVLNIGNDEVEKDYSQFLIHARTDVNSLPYRSTPDIHKVSVHNIGHGNFITLEDEFDETKIVYDIGLPRRSSKNDYKAAYDKIDIMSPDLVIISHWDTDHYMGAYCDNPNLFMVPWIAVKIKESGKINAKRLICLLACHHLIGLIDPDDLAISQPFKTFSMSVGTIELYRGSGKAGRITAINCHGIAVKMEMPNVSALMCGDIPYNCLPDSILYGKDYKYVVIPHHASNMPKKSYLKLRHISNIEYPIICVNGNEELGKSGVTVEKGKHCDEIMIVSNGNLYFTDDDIHSLKRYECVLEKSASIKPIPST